MDDKLKNLRPIFDQSIFHKDHFTEKNMEIVHERMEKYNKRKSFTHIQKLGNWYKPILSVAICFILLIGAFYIINHQKGRSLSSSPKVVQHVSGAGLQTFERFPLKESGGNGAGIQYSQLQLNSITLAFDHTHLNIERFIPITSGYPDEYLKEIRTDSHNNLVQLVYSHFNLTVSNHPFTFTNEVKTQSVKLNLGTGTWLKGNNGETSLLTHISNAYMLIDGAKGTNTEMYMKIANSFNYIVSGGKNLTDKNKIDVGRPKTTTLVYDNEGSSTKKDAVLYVSHKQPISFYFPEQDFKVLEGVHADVLVHPSGLLWNVSIGVLDKPDWKTLIQKAKDDFSKQGTVNVSVIKDDPDLKGTTVISCQNQGNRTIILWFVPKQGERPALRVISTQASALKYGDEVKAIIKTVEAYQ